MELKGYIIFIMIGLTAFMSFVIWSYVKEYRERFAFLGRYKVATIAGVVVASLMLSALITGIFVLMLGRRQ